MKRMLLPLSCCCPLLFLAAILPPAPPARAESWWSGLANSVDWEVNGHRTMSRSKDGIKRTIEGNVPIEVHDGQIATLKEGAVLKLEQTGGPQQRQAELRGTAEAPALWIKDHQGFHAGGEADQKWLRGFLAPFEKKSADNTPAPANPPSSTPEAHAGPTGSWAWSSGTNLTFRDDHTVTGPYNTGTWSWTDEANRELKIEWKDPARIDTLTLSANNNHLQGHNDVPEDVYGDRYVGDAAPATAAAGQAAFSGTDPDSPLGAWHWFVGRDETFHPDGTVTYPENYATWKWVDQAKRTLVVEWKTLPFVDHLTLSKDGKQLTGTNNVPADENSNDVTATRVISPLGTWKMDKGADVTFREDHAAAFDGVNSGFWYWVDESKRQLRVEWSSIPFVDTLTVSEDGNAIQGANHKADVITGKRLTGPLPVPPPEVDEPDNN